MSLNFLKSLYSLIFTETNSVLWQVAQNQRRESPLSDVNPSLTFNTEDKSKKKKMNSIYSLDLRYFIYLDFTFCSMTF